MTTRSRSSRWFLLAGIPTMLVLAALAWPEIAARAAYAVQSAKAAVAAEKLSRVEDLSTAFEHVAEVIRPSVVSVTSLQKIETPQTRMPPPLFDSPFRDFFGDEFLRRFFGDIPRAPRGGGRRELFRRGLGTGVIVSDDGYILTNNHVVRDADKVTVQLSDRRTFTAKVVGTDPKTDIAVLKIEADGLHPAKLGDSDKVRVGQWVVAAGNPFGLTATITAGIISAKGRSNVAAAEYEDFIQTDAAINPGNSGGPLVNLRGEVIGINTAIVTRSGGYMGIGFAIPINMARAVMEDIIEQGRVVRGYLGVVIQDLTPDLAKSFGFDGTEGALVSQVMKDTPADEAGLKPGDIITRFGEKRIHNMQELRIAVSTTNPGTKVKVEFYRDGKKHTTTVEVGELNEETVAAAGAPGKHVAGKLGLTVQRLTPELARRLNIERAEGVAVTDVEPGSPAESAGLQPGDVIISVQGREIRSLRDFREAMRQADLRQGVRMIVESGGMRRFVFIRVR